MAVLSMSKQEFSRLDVLLRVQSGRLRVADACALMGLHRRQVFRLLRGLKTEWRSKLAVEAARPTEQSSASDRGSHPGTVHRPRAVCRLWPNPRGREAGGATWLFGLA